MTAPDYSALFAGISALIALLALVAVVVFGVLNLRQTKRGPDRVPRWWIERPNPSTDSLRLVNDREGGTAYDVDIEPPNTPMFRAETHHDRIEPGQSINIIVKFTGASGMSERKLSLTYREKPHGPKKTWASSVP